jgi:hypothetical protein
VTVYTHKGLLRIITWLRDEQDAIFCCLLCSSAFFRSILLKHTLGYLLFLDIGGGHYGFGSKGSPNYLRTDAAGPMKRLPGQLRLQRRSTPIAARHPAMNISVRGANFCERGIISACHRCWSLSED